MKPAPSTRPTIEKLGIKSGHRIAVLYCPKGHSSILAKLPADVSGETKLTGEPFDVVQGFYFDQKSLKADLRKLRKSIQPLGKIWICWQKGNVTNLSRGIIHDMGEAVKLEAVGECALDEKWSAMKMMLPKAERKPTAKRTK